MAAEGGDVNPLFFDTDSLEGGIPYPMILQLAHVCLLAADLEKCEQFYCEILGLKKKFNFIRGGKKIGFYLEIADRQFVEVFAAADKVPEKGNLITHFCLEVADINELVATLKRHDVAVTEPKLGADHSWQAWCKDPDGVDIEFHHYTEKSCQRTGADCLVNW